MALTMEALIIGDELLEGRRADANGPWLAAWAFRAGVKLKSITLVGDQKDELQSALKQALSRSDLVITTGGLGPTADDCSKQALGELLQAKLESNDKAITIVTEHYQRLKREWTPKTNSYHLLPKGVEPLHNPEGLAPGLLYAQEKKALIMLPGVPREFRSMAEHISEQIKRLAPELPKKTSLTVRTFGLGEEAMFYHTEPNLWQQLEHFGKLSSLPKEVGVDLVLTPREKVDFLDWSNQVKTFLNQTKIAPHIWQWGERTLEEHLIDLLGTREQTVSFAESCTGGLTSSMLTDYPGSSRIFLGGVVSYDNKVKTEVLGVNPQTIERYGAVSIECAQEMAIGMRKLSGSDYALALSGIAGPGGGSADKPVGTLALGWSSQQGDGAQWFHFHGSRSQLKSRFALRALFKLLELAS